MAIIINIPSGAGAGSAQVPSKAILMWPLDFDAATFPQLEGYFLCDGTNGTPDMRNYIPRGTPIAGAVLATAGEASHRHSRSQDIDLTTSIVAACSFGVNAVTTASLTCGFTQTCTTLPLVRNLHFIQRA